MLVQFPDVAYARTKLNLWESFSVWLLAAGCVLAGLAGIVALFIFLRDRRVRAAPYAWPYALTSLAAALLAVVNAFVHSRDGLARIHGFSLFKLLRYFREELLVVLGTSSSDSVLPRMLIKLESLGCKKDVSGMVLSMGYSFNLDGTAIYLTLASVFIAKACNIQLSLGQI